MKTPKRIELSSDEMQELRKRIKEHSLTDKDYEIIEGMAETITFLSHEVHQKKRSIGRILRMLFGAPTEKLKNIFKDDDEGQSGNISNSGHGKENKKPKGHGRNGAMAYSGAKRVIVPNKLKAGDICPGCKKGKVYESQDNGVLINLTGSSPVCATVYELQKLRCNLCGEIFTPDVPEEFAEKKYDETVGSIISLLKYGSGMSFNRLDRLQENLGIPLPASTQWDIVTDAVQKIYPLYSQLLHSAAQGEIIHNDDTTMKILEVMKTKRGVLKRNGVFTTAILSIANGIKTALFFTGKCHAGENLGSLLAGRPSGLSPPIQMCDALSRNLPKAFETILANCLAHGRRKFVEQIDNFPEQCRYVINILAGVYHNDELAKEQHMSPLERLSFHQEKSAPLLLELKNWLTEQFDQKKTEPNSGLGRAISYMLRHWEALTLFLRKEGAPLDNNICERALKLAILHRKNALFYKTLNGAKTGDLFMSIIHTCRLNKVNPFDYLTKIQKHSVDVAKDPEKWMPWNYKAMLESSIV